MKTYKHHFIEKDSDITIISESQISIKKAKNAFFRHRNILERYIASYPLFSKSFEPLEISSTDSIIKLMSDSAKLFNVGPMASVAGALADLMLIEMKNQTMGYHPPRIALVENGGEIVVDSKEEMKIALYAGNNQINLNIGFLITPKDCPIGIATSSATVGHAISLGEADAVTIFADNAALADAAATRIANIVKGENIENSIKEALNAVKHYPDIRGALICRGDKVGQTGRVPTIFKTEGDKFNLLKYKFKTENIAESDFFK